MDLTHRPKSCEGSQVNANGSPTNQKIDHPHTSITNGDQHDSDEEQDLGGHGAVATNPLDILTAKKKKRKKRKPASKRGMGAPTGMEPFYADAPLTPEEFAEERKIYDGRLLTAIQKFERTRRLLPERRDVFYKWLHYGGIKVGPNPFSSGVNQEDMAKDEVAATLSRVHIPDDVRDNLESIHSDDPKYAVDFLGCMRSFLSYRALAIFYFTKKEEVELVTTTLERFMDYLLQHDVCPEFADDILATRNFCREATEELWSTSEAQRWLPGDFNMACSTLFGGNYGKMYDGKTCWGELQPGESAFIGFTPEQATQIVGLGIVGAASEDVYNKYADFMVDEDGAGLDTIQIIKGAGFEIVDLENPTADCKDMYKSKAKDYRPVGRVIAKAWKDPLLPPADLTEDEKNAPREDRPADSYVFFVEEIILKHLSVGQKVVATVRQLNCGVWFFDEFETIYPDYELWLPNEMVEDYKEPRMMADAYAPGAKELGWEPAGGQDEVGQGDEGDTPHVGTVENSRDEGEVD